jgi:hypothetical protein
MRILIDSSFISGIRQGFVVLLHVSNPLKLGARSSETLLGFLPVAEHRDSLAGARSTRWESVRDGPDGIEVLLLDILVVEVEGVPVVRVNLSVRGRVSPAREGIGLTPTSRCPPKACSLEGDPGWR